MKHTKYEILIHDAWSEACTIKNFETRLKILNVLSSNVVCSKRQCWEKLNPKEIIEVILETILS